MTTKWKLAREPAASSQICGQHGVGKLIVCVDGEFFVLVAIGFMVMLMPPSGGKIALGWTPVESGGVQWRGGVVGGGEIQVTIDGARFSN